ncbi:hypothetical protein [Polaromonas naphthalenivorans]|uniref:WYL domain-containing protein n=1 Tax=Polaromonas naphthalenivorans (strain CJ2) TaxID=365044 RepID=A1VSJ2_POLNA|nr:hypothetical protein [Polaromonas naphthalenivorans]ABM38620.1 hypothetical protein Pnap_3323 [Polaromonas naphthalenivorans CJ2]
MAWYEWLMIAVIFAAWQRLWFIKRRGQRSDFSKEGRHYEDAGDDGGNPSLHGKGKFRIRYTDADGQSTQRDITVQPFSSTPRKFSAHCHLRNATRTFIFDRIVQVIDLDTGEVLSNADFFRRVHKCSRLP